MMKLCIAFQHDKVLAAIMFSLNIWNGIKVPFGSGFLFELHEKNPEQYSVQMYYKNNTVDEPMGEPVPVTLPGEYIISLFQCKKAPSDTWLFQCKKAPSATWLFHCKKAPSDTWLLQCKNIPSVT